MPRPGCPAQQSQPQMWLIPADASCCFLPALQRVSEAMRTFFGKLSDPSTLPDFPKLQASFP